MYVCLWRPRVNIGWFLLLLTPTTVCLHFIYLLCELVGPGVTHYKHGGLKTACGSCFFSFYKVCPRIEFRLLGLAPHTLICWAISFVPPTLTFGNNVSQQIWCFQELASLWIPRIHQSLSPSTCLLDMGWSPYPTHMLEAGVRIQVLMLVQLGLYQISQLHSPHS